MPDVLDLIDLRRFASAAVPAYRKDEVLSWLQQPDHLVVDVPAFEVAYAAWRRDQQSRDRRTEQVPPWDQPEVRIALCDWVLDQGRAGRRLRYTTVRRERQGGRRYYLWIDDARKVEVFGRNLPKTYAGAVVRYLQSIPKVVRRAGLRAADGRVLVQGDLDRANLRFLAAMSGDQVLADDLAHDDLHQRVADRLEVPRAVAKVINQSMVGLVGVPGLVDHLSSTGGPTGAACARQLKAAWWGRYAAADSFRQRLQERCGQAALEQRAVKITAPDGRSFRFSPTEVAGAPLPGGRSMGFPSVFSSIFRAIEGLVTDIALDCLSRRRGDLDLRLVIGMFDGLLYSAPADRGAEAAAAVQEASVELKRLERAAGVQMDVA